jgi:hypothetical protein
MSLYLLYKLREYDAMGFSGFEGRYYSLFESFEDDMGRACSLQNFVTALAFKYIVSGELTHHNIPDDPFIESERRQIIFCAALGIPTFYVRSDTKNFFLSRILHRTSKVRNSRRYPGYVRVELSEYRKALTDTLVEDGASLIEMFGIGEIMEDLGDRVKNFEEFSVASRLIRSILNGKPKKSSLNMNSDEFNSATENYYRNELRKRHISEALSMLREDLSILDGSILSVNDLPSGALGFVLEGLKGTALIDRLRNDVLEGRASLEHLVKLIHLILVVEYIDQFATKHDETDDGPAPIYRAGNT